MTAIYLLLILAIAGAVIALEARETLSSVIAVGASGLALSLAFLLLQAPDVAITQYVVEIVSVVILIRAAGVAGGGERDANARSGRANAVVAGLFIAVLFAVAWRALPELPPFGAPAMVVSQAYVDRGLAETGAANVVSSVILDYRAYDTLGEATVLVTAALGVIAVARKRGRRNNTPGEGAP